MYIVLSSADSRDLFPKNNGGNFKVQLRDTLYLNNNYEVALAEILYKRTWNNLFSKNHYLILEYNKNIVFNNAKNSWLAQTFNAKSKEFRIMDLDLGLTYEMYFYDIEWQKASFSVFMNTLVDTYKKIYGRWKIGICHQNEC